MSNKLLAIVFATAALTAHAAAPERVLGRLLVQHRMGAGESATSQAFAHHSAKVEKTIPQIGISVLQVPEQAIDSISKALSETGLFTFVEYDHVAHGALVPNDPSYPSQWHLSTIQAASAWDFTTGSVNVPIAIIDSGVDSTHPDLSSKVIAGWSFLTGTSVTSDVLGHGTAVSGTAAAASDNGVGVTGVAWANPIMPLVVLNSSDSANYSDIASAITYAANHGVRVINISIGGFGSSSTVQSAVDYAWSKGAVIFAAAGNYSSSTPVYPAACNNVVAVSSTESNDTLSSFSSFGSWVSLSAPGNYIMTTNNGGGYGQWYGTSFASPVAAGVAALALSLRPSLSNSALVSLLEQNSDDLGAPGFDPSFGWGRVNAYKVVSAAASLGTDTIPPTVQIGGPAAGAVVSGTVNVSGTASDNIGVTKIEFYVDGNLASQAFSSPFSFQWVTANAANAAHTLVVKAYDAAGNIGQASVSVTVSNTVLIDTQPPNVAITSPLNGAIVSGQTKINVSATDNIAVTQVSIYVDGTQVYTGSVAPYSYSWNTKRISRGSHAIATTAWDQAGNKASAQITVSK